MKIPSKQTLRKYGLTFEDWLALYNKYDGCCHVCLQKPSLDATRAMHIDHEHVPNWKELPPEERKKFVRGLACYVCNRFRLTRGTTLETSKNLYEYLKRYESSKSKDS